MPDSSNPKRHQNLYEYLGAISFFAILLVIFFYPAFLSGALIYSGDLTGSDLLELNIPRRVLAAQAIKDGELPLWESKLGCGISLFAEGQSGPLYPTTLPLYMCFSPTNATNLSLLSTLFIALIGSYVLARLYGAAPLPALLGSLGFGLGGAFIFRLKHLNMVQVMAWLPWSLYALRAYWKYGQRRYLALLTLTWVMQFFAGHPHVCYICWLSCYVYALALAFEPQERPKSLPWYKFLALMLGCTALTLALSAIQLLPTLELVQNSTRSIPVTWEDMGKYPFKFQHLARLVSPFCLGNPADGTQAKDIINEGTYWETSPYFGVISLLLVLALPAFKGARQISIAIIASLALLFTWTAFGPSGGIYWVLWKFCPAFSLFRFPSRMLIPALCLASLLAALGGQHIYAWLIKRYSQRVATLTMVGLIAVSSGELFHANSSYQGYIPANWEQKPAALKLVESTPHQRLYSPFYIFTWHEILGDRGWHDTARQQCHNLNVLPPDIAAIWGVNCPSDRIVFDGGIELSHYFDTQAWQFSYLVSNLTSDGKQFSLPPELGDWLRVQGISHLYSFIPMAEAQRHPQISQAITYHNPDGAGPDLYIYALRNPLKQVRLVQDNLTANLPPFAQFIKDNYPSYSEGSVYEPNLGQNPEIGSATITEEKHNSFTISTSCSTSSMLIIANTYHSNWHAYLEDGQELPVERVNYTFQGVRLPNGEHTVTLRYISPAFAWGWKISALTLLLCLAAGVAIKIKRS